MKPNVMLMVGTVKGAFILRSDASREKWSVSGPYFKGRSVYALAFDGRAARKRLLAGVWSMHFGAVICHSDDLGRSWTEPEAANVKFPEDTGLALQQVWQIAPGPESRPDVLYAGVAPAALFESRDGGLNWSLNRGLFEHPHRAKWTPGFGGLCLHTILTHPADADRLHVAVSTGGVYQTSDGGKSWSVSNRGVRAEFLPNKHPEFGQCVHKIARDPADPDRLFLQNHWGLYRSDDGARTWKDIARGVPSDFGFALAVHPRKAKTAYIVPLESDQFRCVPGARLRVYRTTDGKSWKPLSRGLPQKGAYETVLRDALCTDALEPAGVYFGAKSGKVWGSSDEGESWKTVLEGLPAVLCVKAARLP